MLTENKNYQPIVSIIIITYNSSKFILETLESSKNQTYYNIELIISDDNSDDNTVAICNEWGKINKQRFRDFKVIEAKQNTGIPGNCNRGLINSNGEWIKLIAGDDVLNPNCIEEFVKFSNIENGEFYFSNFDLIDKVGNELEDINNSYKIDESFFKKNSINQYKDLIFEKYLVPAPTSFINRNAIIALKGFDEEINFCEDYPLWVRATKSGVKLFFLDKNLVKYRIYPDSISNKVDFKYKDSLKKMFFKYRFKPLLFFNPLLCIDMSIRFLLIHNVKTLFILKYLLPYTYINYLKRKLK